MKKYNYSLRKYHGNCDLEETENLIRYLLLIQLDLFTNYNFIHGDIHLGNILITKQKKDSTVSFNFDDMKISIITKKLLVLTDFEDSMILSTKTNHILLDGKDVIYTKTLESSIHNTLYCTVDLLKDEKESYRISRLLRNSYDGTDDTRKLVKSYCKGKINTKEYKKEVIKLIHSFITPLFYKMFNTQFVI
jgi:hypothetical protein